MPAIMKIKCNNCDYRKNKSQSATFLICPNGQEIVLQHPAEDIQAFEYTGKHLPELIKEERINVKYGLVCTSCGECDYYLIPGKQNTFGYIFMIASRAADADIKMISCKKCGKQTLRSVVGSQCGCLFALIKVIFGKKDFFLCPKCGKGIVTFEMTGIS